VEENKLRSVSIPELLAMDEEELKAMNLKRRLRAREMDRIEFEMKHNLNINSMQTDPDFEYYMKTYEEDYGKEYSVKFY
jgi:hypothetical protein